MIFRSRYATQRIEFEQGGTAEVYYYLIREGTEDDGVWRYGIQIVMTREKDRQSETVRNITSSPERITQFLEILRRNTVLPYTLREVVELLIG